MRLSLEQAVLKGRVAFVRCFQSRIFIIPFLFRFEIFFGSADFIPGRSDDRRNKSADFAASAVVGAAAAADVRADVATADVAPSYRHKNFTTQHISDTF